MKTTLRFSTPTQFNAAIRHPKTRRIVFDQLMAKEALANSRGQFFDLKEDANGVFDPRPYIEWLLSLSDK